MNNLTQPKVIQLKPAGSRNSPVAPQRYQPLPLPRVLQTKQANHFSPDHPGNLCVTCGRLC